MTVTYHYPLGLLLVLCDKSCISSPSTVWAITTVPHGGWVSR